MKADFFDLQRHLSDGNFIRLLQNFPHKLVDLFGNTVSQKGTPENWVESTIQLEGSLEVAKLSAPEAQKDAVKQFIELELQNKIAITRYRMTNENKEILAQDLGAILYMSENELLGFTDILDRLMRLLRSHILVESVSIFGIYDGFTLEGLAGLGNHSANAKVPDSWKLDSSSLAGIAAATRKPYHSENPSKDPKFQATPGANVPRNLVCQPIIHGSTLLGVLNVSNKVLGAFNEEDLVIISRFGKIASHLLQKHFLKTRMESYAKDSDNLGKYLSSKIAKNVKALDSVELGGVEKKVVCLFIDIRSFTTISEGIKATMLVKLLNFYFERLTAVIEKHEGTVDKIVGDLILAVWNMPQDQPNPELLAVKCAIEMQKEMRRTVAPYWREHGGIEEMGAGIGINAGTAVVGNLGSSRFMNYTVIGDAINTAQRLEAQAESGEVWVAESIMPYVEGKVEKPIRVERGIRLKGKEKLMSAHVFKPLHYDPN